MFIHGLLNRKVVPYMFERTYIIFFSVGKFKTLKYSPLFTVYSFLNLLFCVCYYYCIFVACVITSLILMTDAVRILHLKNDEMQGSKYVGKGQEISE